MMRFHYFIAVGALCLLRLLSAGSPVFAAELSPAIADAITDVGGHVDMPADEYPWSAVAHVSTESGGHCAAAMVGPALAVTAAHCLFDVRRMWFVPPGLITVTSRAHDSTTARTYVVPGGYREGEAPSGANTAHDWALLILRDDIGLSTGWFGLADFDRNAMLAHRENYTAFMLAAPREAANAAPDSNHHNDAMRATHINCTLDDFARGLSLFVHRCNTAMNANTNAMSEAGSPIFYFRDGVAQLAGLHIAATSAFRPPRGVGVPAVNFAQGVRELGYGSGMAPQDSPDGPQQSIHTLLEKLGHDPAQGLQAATQRFLAAQGLETTDVMGYELLAHLLSALSQ